MDTTKPKHKPYLNAHERFTNECKFIIIYFTRSKVIFYILFTLDRNTHSHNIHLILTVLCIYFSVVVSCSQVTGSLKYNVNSVMQDKNQFLNSLDLVLWYYDLCTKMNRAYRIIKAWNHEHFCWDRNEN